MTPAEEEELRAELLEELREELVEELRDEADRIDPLLKGSRIRELTEEVLMGISVAAALRRTAIAVLERAS